LICFKAAKLQFRGLLFFLPLLLSGCGTLVSPLDMPTDVKVARKVELITVPFFSQGDDLCGPASMSMMLNFHGQSLTPEKLRPLIYIPGKRGTLQTEMLAVARRFGFVPYVVRPKPAALLKEIDSGNPVLILQNLGFSWYPKWHYAVVVGYDLDRDIFILRSGFSARTTMPTRRFMRYWMGGDSWAMLVLPPNKLPATAEEKPYLESVSALERLGKWKAVTTAYETAITRWPDGYLARLGAGTGYYQQGELLTARNYYERAIRLNPRSAIAHNNLAQTLYELGQLQSAHEHALKAVSLAGKPADAFVQTLRQIELKMAR
jgi:hypothetical protein